jgi:intracellular sulfur oxidation DsrE/DsrF family protein
MNYSLGKMAAAAAFGLAVSSAVLAGPNDPVKVIYHVNLGNEQATDALRNANNHLGADPTAKIVFVTHSKGVDFLLEGAKDKNGNSYDALVQDLAGKGVEFRVCKITLDRRKIDPKRVIQGTKLVPSGVAEVSRLQAKEGFAYLKP